MSWDLPPPGAIVPPGVLTPIGIDVGEPWTPGAPIPYTPTPPPIQYWPQPAPQPVPLPTPISYPTNGLGELPPVAQPMALPVIGAVAAVRAAIAILMRARGFVSLTAIKGLIQKYGAAAVKTVVGIAVFSQIMEMIGMDMPGDTPIPMRRGRRRRYSIGTNPRVNTLVKVAKRVDKLFDRYNKVMRKFKPQRRGGRRDELSAKELVIAQAARRS